RCFGEILHRRCESDVDGADDGVLHIAAQALDGLLELNADLLVELIERLSDLSSVLFDFLNAELSRVPLEVAVDLRYELVDRPGSASLNIREDTGGDQAHQHTDAGGRERQAGCCQECHDAVLQGVDVGVAAQIKAHEPEGELEERSSHADRDEGSWQRLDPSILEQRSGQGVGVEEELDRKSTRLNSSHVSI